MSYIEVKNLTRTFRRRSNPSAWKALFRPMWKTKNAVNDLSFSVERGESVAFLGPNGAGKTTTTKILTGLVYPSTGGVSVAGHIPQDRDTVFLRKIGLVMGNKSGLNWDLSARQSFDLLYRIYGVEDERNRRRVDALCDMLDVGHVFDTQIRRLSLGERMKLELIGSLIHDPEILFLDEPTIGLDVVSKRKIREFLKDVHKSGKTLVLTSHDMDDISAVCERAVIINYGKLVFDGPMKQLMESYDVSRMLRIVTSNPLSEEQRSLMNSLGTIHETSDLEFELVVDKSMLAKAMSTVTDKLDVADVEIAGIPLESVIEDIFTRDQPASA
jgi:ABC-2 type transport system ATP-binding protein